MPKPLPTNKAAFMLVARRIAENKENFSQFQLCIMTQALDRWAKVLGLYDVPLTSPHILYKRKPRHNGSEDEPEGEEVDSSPYTPKMTMEEAFKAVIGGSNAPTDQDSK